MDRWMRGKLYRGSQSVWIRLHLYLTLAAGVMFILSSAGEVRYDNQRAFLKAGGYESADFADPGELFNLKEGAGCTCMEVLTGEFVVAEEERGADIYRYEAPAEVYRVPDGAADLEGTPFTAANLNGYDVRNLEQSDVILSFDLGKRLHVRQGDFIRLISFTGDSSIRLRVAGIMRTKYRYQEIGRTGTALLRLSRKSFEALADDVKVCVFRTDSSGERTKEEELDECSGKESGSGSAADHIFPVMGFLLLLFIVVRECSRISRRYRPDFILLYREGYNCRKLMRLLFWPLAAAVLAATAGAVFLYCRVFMELWAGEQVRFPLGLKAGVITFEFQILILKGVLRNEGKGIADS